MEDIKEKYGSLLEHIQDYINNRVELVKLMAIEKGAFGISNAAAFFILAFLGLFFIIFLSITLAIGLSLLIGSSLIGFLIVTFIYLITAILLFYNKQKWMIEPISNTFIKNALQDYNNQNKQHEEK
ncbi:MAG: phage holin family protein [Bacteroidetes bacterium]|nr:phage holin family protein [Bacteroidota bacterium]